jgi:hypothetical protein
MAKGKNNLRVVFRGCGGVVAWAIPNSELQIMWRGPGSGLWIGHVLGRVVVAGATLMRIKHPSACDAYETLKAARAAAEAFVAAGRDTIPAPPPDGCR